MISLLELELLFEREGDRLSTHLEHVADLIIDTMVLQAVLGGIVRRKIKQTETIHLLPEAELGGRFPKRINLRFVSIEYPLIVHNKQRVRRNILRERRKVQ